MKKKQRVVQYIQFVIRKIFSVMQKHIELTEIMVIIL